MSTSELSTRHRSHQPHTNQKSPNMMSYLGIWMLYLYYRISLSKFYWCIKHTNTVHMCAVIVRNGRELYYLFNDTKFYVLRWRFPKLWHCRREGPTHLQQSRLLYWSAIRNCGRLLSKIIQLKLGRLLQKQNKYISCFTIILSCFTIIHDILWRSN